MFYQLLHMNLISNGLENVSYMFLKAKYRNENSVRFVWIIWYGFSVNPPSIFLIDRIACCYGLKSIFDVNLSCRFYVSSCTIIFKVLRSVFGQSAVNISDWPKNMLRWLRWLIFGQSAIDISDWPKNVLRWLRWLTLVSPLDHSCFFVLGTYLGTFFGQ